MTDLLLEEDIVVSVTGTINFSSNFSPITSKVQFEVDKNVTLCSDFGPFQDHSYEALSKAQGTANCDPGDR